MSFAWFEILVFPGIAFIIFLTILLEQINYRIYSKFSFEDTTKPMFIPLVNHLKFFVAKKQERKSFKSILQSILLLIFLAIPLFGTLFLPIAKHYVYYLKDYWGENDHRFFYGTIGLISFEGDILVLMGLFVLFGALMLLIQLLTENKPTKESLHATMSFLLMDIPLMLTFSGVIITKRSLSLSLVAQDIRFIVQDNPLFGFLILLPLSLIISIYTLSLKFDQMLD